ncbi:MAG: serine hydrolase domain-containing protein [Lewinella sp.]
MFSQIIRKFVVLCLLLSLTTSLTAQQELKHRNAKLDTIFSHYTIGEKPGVSIAILEKDKPVFLKSYGHANLEDQIKNTSNTLFNAADLAKQFTVFCILILEDQGELSINDDIKKYVPELDELSLDITLKYLMESTSGLRDVVDLRNWTGYQNGDVVTKQDIVALVAKQRRLNYPSGDKVEYNRTGYVLLTEVIEKVSGMPFSEFAKEHIFEPLGMENSVFVDSHSELTQNGSFSYAAKEDGFTKIVNNTSFIGGTNLYTSTSDFAKWLQNMSEQKIGKPAFYEYLQTNVVLTNGESLGYTPGIYRDNRVGYWVVHLEGFDHGYSTYMMNVPEYDFSLIYFSNDVDFPAGDVYEYLYDWFHTDYSIALDEPFVAPPVKLAEQSTKELQKHTGDYLFEDGFSFRKVVLKNDTLFYARNEDNQTAMVPIAGDHTFKILVPGTENYRITFKNEGEVLEFRALSAKYANDYVTLGRKLKFCSARQKAFSGDFRNEALGHVINIRNLNGDIQLKINDASVVFDQIGEDEFLPRSNDKVQHLRLERDEQRNIIGVYLSGYQLKDLYYELM